MYKFQSLFCKPKQLLIKFEFKEMNSQLGSLAHEQPTIEMRSNHYSHPYSTQNLPYFNTNQNPSTISDPLEHKLSQLHTYYRRQITICHSEITQLKDQLQLAEKTIVQQQHISKELKNQISIANKQYLQQKQERKKIQYLLERMKIDNSSMEMTIEKFSNEKKQLYSSYGSIQNMRREIQSQIKEKTKTIDELGKQNRHLERMRGQSKIKIEQLQHQLSEKQTQNRQYRSQIKSFLEKHLTLSNQITKYDYQLKQASDIERLLRQKLDQTEQEKSQIVARLGLEVGMGESQRTQNMDTLKSGERYMVDIQNQMQQIEGTLNDKREQSRRAIKNSEKLRISIEALRSQLL